MVKSWQEHPLQILLTADQCTLKITNRRNVRIDETSLHEKAKGEMHGPVQAARGIRHILSDGETEEILLSEFITNEGTWDTITSAQTLQYVQSRVKPLNLHENGIDRDLVSVHLLRA